MSRQTLLHARPHRRRAARLVLLVAFALVVPLFTARRGPWRRADASRSTSWTSATR